MKRRLTWQRPFCVLGLMSCIVGCGTPSDTQDDSSETDSESDQGSHSDEGSSESGEGSSSNTTSGTQTTSSSTPNTDTGDSSGDDSESSSSDDDDDDDDDSSDTSGSDTTSDPQDCPHEPVEGDPAPEFTKVAEGFSIPVFVTSYPGAGERLYVVEKTGTVRILEAGQTEAPTEAFMEVQEDSGSNEMGLLGLAFHPDFPEDPRVYVNYNPAEGRRRTLISEFRLESGNPDKVDPNTERILLEIEQPESNHKGGMLTFGPDDYLYIGMGDGGGAGDDHGADGNGQNKGALLGKILRIGVEPDGDSPYTVPSDNPFVGMNDFAPEIWAWGMRNPWRFDFDRKSGLLYAGDVGQDKWEEIDIIEKGKNYGWREMEGFHCYGGASCGEEGGAPNSENDKGYVMPIAEYSHNGGQASVTGGYVYRYCEVPGWEGRYFYVDYVTTALYALTWDGSSTTLHGDEGKVGNFIDNWALTSFGLNTRGEIFATATHKLGEESGRIYRLSPQR